MWRVILVTSGSQPRGVNSARARRPVRRVETAAMLDRVLLILGAVLLLAALLLERPTPMAIAPREVQSASSSGAPASWR
jgi:hypothetical protein